ncbi:hypothetical protein [Emticicia sp. C21]|uniref:hypothetical protein n=1 Tax=Emticicia sp. C21 TaxID=2302915 RepID=UPI000E3560B3|nr:hypothetical protein [Emticicia sp. C21]RFS16918.1 hypothetical protein D0T08_09580 [Emticicia sp. C21]
MKKGFLLVLTIISLSCLNKRALFTEKELYDTDEIKATHNKIAILPVNYVFNKDGEMLIEKIFTSNDPTKAITNQEDVGHRIQRILYEEFAAYHKEVVWMSDEKVNGKLNEKNINYEDLRRLSKAEIAKALEVDAVIYCDIFVSSTKVNRVSAGPGIPSIPLNGTSGIYSDKVPKVEFTVEIHSGIEEDLLWKAKSVFNRDRFYVERSFRKVIKSDLSPILPLN